MMPHPAAFRRVSAALAGILTLTACESTSTTGPLPEVRDFEKDYVEALFLGTGPLIPQDGFTACGHATGRWAAYPPGTTVTVVLSSSLDQGSDGVDTKALIRAAVGSVSQATNGSISVVVEETADPDPHPELDQVTATDHPDPTSTGCAFDRGCIHLGFREGSWVFATGRAVLKESVQPADAFVHDVIGHGIMGLCHIDQELIGGNDVSLMAGGPGAFTGFIPDRLSSRDIAAAQSVYGSGLSPGATREDFLAAGLINP